MAYAAERGAYRPDEERYWREFLPRRKAFIAEVVERLRALPVTPGTRTALNAVRVASQQHAAITTGTCARYVRHWRSERRGWRQRLAALDTGLTVTEALLRVGLRPPAPRPRPTRPRFDDLWPGTGDAGATRVVDAATRTVISPTGRIVPGSSTLVVLVPGFLDSAFWPGAATLASALRDSGRTTLTFDSLGVWRTSGDPDRMTPSQQVRDIVSVLGMVPPHDRVVVIGHSLGAHLACLAAADDPRITDVVAIMPPRCFVWPHDYDPDRDTWRRAGERRFVVTKPRSTTRWEFRVPHTVVLDAVDHDLPGALTSLSRQQILFVAGSQDEVIPTASVERLFEVCGGKKSMVVLPVGHDYRDNPGDLALVNRTVVEWLDATEPATRPAGPRHLRVGSGGP